MHPMFLRQTPFSTEKLQGTVTAIKSYTLILKRAILGLYKFPVPNKFKEFLLAMKHHV